MILLYTTLILVLSTVLFLVKRRAARLERHYARLANEASTLLPSPSHRGNGKDLDPGETARRQYELGLAVQKRDRIEARYTAWQESTEKLERVRQRLRAWKGKTLPYTFGILDVTGLLGLLDYLGAAQYANVRALFQLVRGLLIG